MAGTITALEFQQHNKERVNVYLDGEFAFGVTVLEAARLRKGQHLTDQQIESLRATDAVEKAYDRAVRFLAQRPRSSAEVRRSLAEKEVAPHIIDDVLARLESQGYLDDLAFARYWISNRQQFRPKGTRALRFELREKGIESGIVDEALAGFDASEAAYQSAQDRARRFKGLDKRAFKEKMGSYLARRGFSYDIASEVINRLWAELEEEAAGVEAPSQNDIEE